MRYNQYDFKPLFSTQPLSELLNSRHESARQSVSGWRDSDLADLDEAVPKAQGLALAKRIDIASVEKPEISGGGELNIVDVSVRVKIQGDIRVVHHTPTTFEVTGGPQASVKGDCVIFARSFPATVQPDEIGSWRDGMLAKLKRWIEFANKDIDAYNATVIPAMERLARERAEQLANIRRLNDSL